jgi:hypothetical protein
VDHVVATMVTQEGRESLARMSLASFLSQTWDNSELIILRTGPTPVLHRGESYPNVKEVAVEQGNKKLSDLRNMVAALAPPDAWQIQWDDDDWSHKERIAYQLRFAKTGSAVVLKHQIRLKVRTAMAITFSWPWSRPPGIPGTILLPPREQVEWTYQESKARSEDTQLILDYFPGQRLIVIPNEDKPHMYIRLYHGNNTWDEFHFFQNQSLRPINQLANLEAREYVDYVYRTHIARTQE